MTKAYQKNEPSISIRRTNTLVFLVSTYAYAYVALVSSEKSTKKMSEFVLLIFMLMSLVVSRACLCLLCLCCASEKQP